MCIAAPLTDLIRKCQPKRVTWTDREHDDVVFPVAFASRKLLRREKNYSVTEECFAIVFGIQIFQKYLHGTTLLLKTDHSKLA